jgi:hypothetical protein
MLENIDLIILPVLFPQGIFTRALEYCWSTAGVRLCTGYDTYLSRCHSPVPTQPSHISHELIASSLGNVVGSCPTHYHS